MKNFIGIGMICFILFSFAGGEISGEELQLLVLSEIEERIAGKMAFYSIEQTLSGKGYSVASSPKISTIGRHLAKYSDRVYLHYSFYVIEGDIEPQALSLPGGYVFVSQSMLEAVCRSDDDIAFILGHEIAHSALRHYADYKLRDDQQVAYVKQLIQQHTLLEETEQPKSSDELQSILFPYINKVRQMKEIESDQFGALYALRAGYQYSAGIRVLERLRRLFGEEFQLEKDMFASTSEFPSSSSTHPTLSERIEQLELFRLKAIEVSKLFPGGREALDQGNHQEASMIFESILSLFPQSRTAHIGLGVAYHLQYWDSSPRDEFLLAYPGALELEHLQLLRGSPNFQTLQQAVEEYRMVLSFEPGNKYAANNLGVALAELNQFAEAETVLREAQRLDPQDFILFNLALVLRQRYQETQQRHIQKEAVALLKQYLRLTPYDDVAVEYLQELEQTE